MDRYFDDLEVGEKFESPAIAVTEEEVLEFARKFDPQAMHIDKAVAERGMFKGLIASGWHTAALVMKLNAELRMFGNTPVLGLGVDNLQWPQPVRPGDTLRVVTEVIKLTPSRSKPDFGIVGVRTTALNQREEAVFVAHPNVWVPRRPA